MKLRILMAGLVFGGAAFAADAGAELFQKAVTQESAAGNLDEAIKLYQRVAREYASNRPLAAKALVQEARCYEKLGQDKAVKLYEQVARDFGDQPEQAAAARERLAALGAGAKSKGGAAMVAHQIPLPATAAVLAQSDGKHVFYVDYQAGGLVAANMDGTSPRVILPLPANHHRYINDAISVSPDGRKVAALVGDATRHSSYFVAATDGSGVHEVYRHQEAPTAGARPMGGWSPDGTHFLGDITNADGFHTVGILSAADGSLQTIKNEFAIKGKGGLVSMSGGMDVFSPDGKYAVFGVRNGTSTQSEIRIVAVDGSYGAKLVDHPSSNGVIGFTPDGKQLLFQSDRSGQGGIYALAVSNGRAQGEPVLIKQEAGMLNYDASLTKDGTLFYSVGRRRGEIFIANLDPARGTMAGTPQVFTGPFGMTPQSAAWSPDGKEFAYLSGSDHGGDARLTIRTLVSGKEIQHKMPPATHYIAGWTTDGRGIYTMVRDITGTDPPLEVHLVSPDTGTDKMVVTIPGAHVLASVAPTPGEDDLLIAFGVRSARPGGPSGVVRFDPRTGQLKDVIPTGTISQLQISPDGVQVAALESQANRARILLKSLTGGDWKTLATVDGTGYTSLCWMPDGSLIFAKEASNSALFRVAASGGKVEKVGELPNMNFVAQIRASPDGRQLVFGSAVNHAELWALENFLPKEMRGK